MLYPALFAKLEQARWSMQQDILWDSFDSSLITEEQAYTFKFDPAPPLETLMLHFCGEMRLTQWYKKACQWHSEPVIKQIYHLLST